MAYQLVPYHGMVHVRILPNTTMVHVYVPNWYRGGTRVPIILPYHGMVPLGTIWYPSTIWYGGCLSSVSRTRQMHTTKAKSSSATHIYYSRIPLGYLPVVFCMAYSSRKARTGRSGGKVPCFSTTSTQYGHTNGTRLGTRVLVSTMVPFWYVYW
jgi:hypothetical protein